MSNKVSGKLQDYLIAANHIIDDEDLSIYDVSVYIALSRRSDGKRGRPCYPSLAGIAKLARCSVPMVIKSINKLIEKGYLEKENVTNKNGRDLKNNYYLKDAQFMTGEASRCKQHLHPNDVGGVNAVNTNNSKTFKTSNKSKNINNQNIAANAVQRNNTLFDIPSKQEEVTTPKTLSKIEQAELDGDWKKVTTTDFVDYFVSKHNDIFPHSIKRQKSQDGNYLVKMFRENFIERFQLNPDQVCPTIDQILQTYKRTETNPEYKDSFDLAAFKHGRVIDKLMQSVKYLDQYGSLSYKTQGARPAAQRTDHVPEIF